MIIIENMSITAEIYDLWDRPSNEELESGKYIFINIDKNKEDSSDKFFEAFFQ